MAEREPVDIDPYGDAENLPDCGTPAEQRARFQKYSKLLEEYYTLGFPPDELLINYEENRRAFRQFYSAWMSCSFQFDNLLEAGGSLVEHGKDRDRTTFLFQPHIKEQAQKVWDKTCELYDDFFQIARVSYQTWGIDMNYNDVHWKNSHQKHMDRQEYRVDGRIIYSIA